jgi:hypothetical protein
MLYYFHKGGKWQQKRVYLFLQTLILVQKALSLSFSAFKDVFVQNRSSDKKMS